MLAQANLMYAVIGVLMVGSGVYYFLQSRKNVHRSRKNVLFPAAGDVKAHTPEATAQEPVFDGMVDVRVVDTPVAVAPRSVKPVTSAAPVNGLLVVSVMAKPGVLFSSYELLQAITNAGFHFGERHIFHFYADSDRRKHVLFSLASAVKPGVFDLDNIGAFSTPGLTMFMDASMHDYPLAVFQQFIETAHQLTEELEGVLQESPKTPWAKDSYARYEQQVKQLIAAKSKLSATQLHYS